MAEAEPITLLAGPWALLFKELCPEEEDLSWILPLLAKDEKGALFPCWPVKRYGLFRCGACLSSYLRGEEGERCSDCVARVVKNSWTFFEKNDEDGSLCLITFALLENVGRGCVEIDSQDENGGLLYRHRSRPSRRTPRWRGEWERGVKRDLEANEARKLSKGLLQLRGDIDGLQGDLAEIDAAAPTAEQHSVHHSGDAAQQAFENRKKIDSGAYLTERGGVFMVHWTLDS